jgi:hypothetical protein
MSIPSWVDSDQKCMMIYHHTHRSAIPIGRYPVFTSARVVDSRHNGIGETTKILIRYGREITPKIIYRGEVTEKEWIGNSSVITG